MTVPMERMGGETQGQGGDDRYEDGEGFFDDAGRWWPNNAEWCDRCQGMGTEDCDCGGDFCVCGAYDSLTCRRCDGEGYWIPTPRDLAAREANAKWWRELYARLERETGAEGIAHP